MKTPSWHLRTVTEVAANAKYTFYLPSKATIAALKVGDSVKLTFELKEPPEDGPSAERMWVRIEMIDGSGGYLGRLDNDPGFIRDLKYDDHVRFSDCHIINTSIDEVEPGESLQEKYFPRCLVTNKVLRDGEKVAILYREEPQAPHDSGWRLLAGTESDSYVNDADNVHFVSLGAVLNRDDAFIDLLDSPVGSAFQRNPETGAFDSVGDDEGEGDDESTTVH